MNFMPLWTCLNYVKVSHHSFCTATSASLSTVLIKKIGPVTCIGLSRPKKNCLNKCMVEELKNAFENFEKDNSSSIAVLYGERGTFSNGCDPEEFQENPHLIRDIEKVGLLEKYLLKPTVAAVSGHALGLGFDLALWCDFRIVEDTAVMGGFSRRFGVPTNDVVIHRLYSLLGLNKAMDLILTGRVFTAKEAQECNIAARIVACGSGLGQAVNFAHSLANLPQACLKADRAALISLSGKYPSRTRKLIEEEMNIQREIAEKEATEGLHITMTGDVRKKNT